MALRIGLDLDGTLADLSTAYHEVHRRTLGANAAPATVSEDTANDQTWKVIEGTSDFWMTLKPLEPGVIRRLFELSLERKWEVVFITQRPTVAGDTVQRQTQRWLIQEGFETPSVLPISGSRGRAVAALQLDVLIDDLPKNCVDAVSDSRCRPILVLREADDNASNNAKRLKIGTVRSVAEALDLLATSPATPTESSISRIMKRLGF